jgi:hypothetical protein
MQKARADVEAPISGVREFCNDAAQQSARRGRAIVLERKPRLSGARQSPPPTSNHSMRNGEQRTSQVLPVSKTTSCATRRRSSSRIPCKTATSHPSTSILTMTSSFPAGPCDLWERLPLDTPPAAPSSEKVSAVPLLRPSSSSAGKRSKARATSSTARVVTEWWLPAHCPRDTSQPRPAEATCNVFVSPDMFDAARIPPYTRKRVD